MFEVLETLRFKRPTDEVGTARIVVPVQCVISSLLVREEASTPEAAEQRVQFRDPEGEVLEDLDAVVELDLESSMRTRTFVRLDGIPFTIPGEYLFEVSVRPAGAERWKRVARVPVALTEIGRSQQHSP